MRTNLQGLDINNGESVQNVQACAKLCDDTDQCRAMTYVHATSDDTQNGICWMKGTAPPGQPNPHMISARKIPAEPEKRVPL
ncbi:MAG: PAN domain-containing protein [Sphingomicrobium sp.]